MANLIPWLVVVAIVFGGAGGAQAALTIDPISIPFTLGDGAGEFEFVGSSDGSTELSFQVHMTSGVLDVVGLVIGSDPYYMASTTPGPNVDVDPRPGNVRIFFHMGTRFAWGLHAGQTSDVFTTIFPNGIPVGALCSVDFYGGENHDTASFQVVPEPSSLLLCGFGLLALACKQRPRSQL
jgi:hypothetical protein